MATPVKPMLPIGPTECGGPNQPPCDPITCIAGADGLTYAIHGAVRIVAVRPVAPVAAPAE